MKFEYEWSQLALKDINNIWNYSRENWSISQANIYYEQIFDEIEKNCFNLLKGRAIQQIKSDHRIVNVKSHLIVFKVEKEKVFVDRILHKIMDIEFHLNQP